jgi:hypothetical protein
MIPVKRKIPKHEPSTKHRGDPSRQAVSRRSTRKTDGESIIRPAGFEEESEAELAVTKICDLILGRLSETKTQHDQDLRKQRARRPPD